MRTDSIQTLFKQVGSLLAMMGHIFIIPAVVSGIYREWFTVLGFAISSAVSYAAGYWLKWQFRSADEPEYNNVIVIVAVGWLFLVFFGGLPFFFVAQVTPQYVMDSFMPSGAVYESSLPYFKNLLHCTFESRSAYTTTGLTITMHEPTVGMGLLFYRCFAQWVGGAGFIILALAVLTQHSSQSSLLFYNNESFGGKLTVKVKETAQGIWKAYMVITVLTSMFLIAGTCLILPGYPLARTVFDSVCHAMTGLSSGGFSTLDDSIAGYHSAAMDYLHLVPMMLGSFSLPFYYRVVYQKKFGEIWRDIQTRNLCMFFVAGSVTLSLLLMYSHSAPEPFREGIFQYISAISTTGWQTSNILAWDDKSFLFIIFGAMFIGGAAGGTVGGIKIIRALVINKGIIWQVNKTFISKNAIKTIRFNGKTLLPEQMNAEVASSATYALMFVGFMLACTFITSFFIDSKYSFLAALFESTAAQSTAGLTVGITEPTMHPVVETIYIFQMWIGRLEIIPILALIRAVVFGSNPKII